MFKFMYPLEKVELDSAVPAELSVNDMVDFMADQDNPDEGTEKVVTDSHVQEKEDDKKEKEPEHKEEEKPEEIKLEDLDEIEFKDVPRRQEILKEFPEIFKKFPGIEHALYREKEYTELFPTVQDAKDAQERISDYEHFEKALFEGRVNDVLKSVKESDPKAFARISENYLPQLFEVDQPAYYKQIENVLRTAAVNMWNAGHQNQNDNLKAAAQIFNQFMFGNGQITAPSQPTQQQPQNNELEEQRIQFQQERLDASVNDVTNRVQNVIKANIDKYLDPKGVMTDYIRGKAASEILDKIDEAIGNDNRFQAIKDKLWEACVDDNFSQLSKDKIKAALLNKAKTVLPDILKSVRSNALQGLGKREAMNTKRDDKPVERGRPAQTSGQSTSKASEIPKGMSSYDFLNQE